MVITLLESYCLWMETFDRKAGFNRDETRDPLYLEKGFYLSTVQIILCKLAIKFLQWFFLDHFIILANLSFFTVIRMLTSYAKDEIYKSKSLTLDLFRGFMLASIAKFFFLPIIIWRDNISGISSAVHLVIVIGYFLVSLIYIHASVVGCSKKISTATILLSFLINKYIWFNLHFNGNMY